MEIKVEWVFSISSGQRLVDKVRVTEHPKPKEPRFVPKTILVNGKHQPAIFVTDTNSIYCV